jgi:hypothetical protein
MEKYLYFNSNDTTAFDESDKCYCVPVSKFRGFNHTSGATGEITMAFEPVEGPIELGDNLASADVSDLITLTITANKQKEVIEAILAAMDAPKVAGTGKSMITVADAPNSEFLSVGPDSSGTAVAISGVAISILTRAAS